MSEEHIKADRGAVVNTGIVKGGIATNYINHEPKDNPEPKDNLEPKDDPPSNKKSQWKMPLITAIIMAIATIIAGFLSGGAWFAQ